MTTLPDFLKFAEPPRLIPVVSDSSKEKRALSILLAAMVSVEEFRRAMLASLGVRVGSRASLEAFTECALVGAEGPEDRPDGLIMLNLGKKQWRALIEAKIGSAELEAEQIERYAERAKSLEFDALITISNQFAALPDHHPVRLPKSLTKRIAVLHWSWMFVVTQAHLVLAKDGIESDDQHYILQEALRYWRHDSAGISTFDRMNREWKDLVGKVRNRAALNKSSPEVENTVASWFQEERDLCLLLTRRLGRTVTLRLPRAHREDPVLRMRDGCEGLVETETLGCEFDIPDAAAPLEVMVDLATRTIRCSMRLQAPADRQRGSARVNWLVKQLAKTDPAGTHIKAYRRGRAEESEQPLSVLRENPAALQPATTDVPPIAFEVFIVEDLGGRFAGCKTFIEGIELVVPQFYERVGQHLRAWVPAPPKISQRDPADEDTTTCLTEEQLLDKVLDEVTDSTVDTEELPPDANERMPGPEESGDESTSEDGNEHAMEISRMASS
jgi:hypothetical protein